MKKNNWIIRVFLLAIGCAFVGYPFWSNQVPVPLPFKALTPQAFVGLIAWLFAVTVFVERAVEVVVMVFRDQKADLLDEAESRATDASDNATKAAALANTNAVGQADKDKAATVAEGARMALAAAHKEKVIYRAETKEIALLVGFMFGTLVSLAGVRALHGLLAETAVSDNLFTVADILVTGGMIAGGSEGIHRMANVFTSFMDSLSARTDQTQKKS